MEYYLDQVQDIFYINPLGSEQPTYDQDNVPFKHEIIPFFLCLPANPCSDQPQYNSILSGP